MTPPHRHINCEVLLRAGRPPTITVGEPGAHGATVFGMHGIGVSTPSAAVVAAATVGLAILMHIPKGITFIIGLLSMMLAAGTLLVITRLTGRTVSVLGAMPNVHWVIAPQQTCIPMVFASWLGSILRTEAPNRKVNLYAFAQQ